MEPLDGSVLHHSASMPTNLTDTSRDPHHYHPTSTVDRLVMLNDLQMKSYCLLQ